MPSTKDFERKGKASSLEESPSNEPSAPKRARRRPGREEAQESPVSESSEAASVQEEPDTSTTQGSQERKKIQIEFPGSEILRARVPRVFELAETVAEEWVNDGNFEGLPVGHPLAQAAASFGLKRAKKIEKKLEEKGVFMMARMGLEFAKSKLKLK